MRWGVRERRGGRFPAAHAHAETAHARRPTALLAAPASSSAHPLPPPPAHTRVLVTRWRRCCGRSSSWATGTSSSRRRCGRSYPTWTRCWPRDLDRALTARPRLLRLILTAVRPPGLACAELRRESWRASRCKPGLFAVCGARLARVAVTEARSVERRPQRSAPETRRCACGSQRGAGARGLTPKPCFRADMPGAQAYIDYTAVIYTLITRIERLPSLISVCSRSSSALAGSVAAAAVLAPRRSSARRARCLSRRSPRRRECAGARCHHGQRDIPGQLAVLWHIARADYNAAGAVRRRWPVPAPGACAPHAAPTRGAGARAHCRALGPPAPPDARSSWRLPTPAPTRAARRPRRASRRTACSARLTSRRLAARRTRSCSGGWPVMVMVMAGLQLAAACASALVKECTPSGSGAARRCCWTRQLHGRLRPASWCRWLFLSRPACRCPDRAPTRAPLRASHPFARPTIQPPPREAKYGERGPDGKMSREQ